jgi:hypothetical protein
MPELRRLNEQGISKFIDFLQAIETESSIPVPFGMLTDIEASEELSVKLEVEQRTFPNRTAVGKYLYEVFSEGNALHLDGDRGVWVWLSLFYFDQLCPSKTDGTRNVGEYARYVPSGHAWRYYRHLLAGPYLIYKAYRERPDRAKIILCPPLSIPGEFVGQLASRQDFVQNQAIIEAATFLYFDEQAGQPKQRVALKEHKPGTLRRFVDVVNQLDVTWDLFSLSGEELVRMLPAEFDRYKPVSFRSAP